MDGTTYQTLQSGGEPLCKMEQPTVGGAMEDFPKVLLLLLLFPSSALVQEYLPDTTLVPSTPTLNNGVLSHPTPYNCPKTVVCHTLHPSTILQWCSVKNTRTITYTILR